MPGPGLLATFVRELIVDRSLPREPEPHLVMDDPEQVEAYAQAGRVDGIMSAAYLFHTARASQVIAGSRRVLDLGCGPATQLGQIAALNPDSQFVGVDLSEGMLASASEHVGQLGLANVSLRQADVTKLDAFEEASFDAILCMMTLHHLPTFGHLERCFAEMRRVLRPGGALYVADFGRLKSLRSVVYFAYLNRERQPHLFSLDFERSMRAAFVKEEFDQAARTRFGPGIDVLSTFKVPFLVVVKTPDRELPASTRNTLRTMARALPRRYKGDLGDLRRFFALGGLGNDPFR